MSWFLQSTESGRSSTATSGSDHRGTVDSSAFSSFETFIMFVDNSLVVKEELSPQTFKGRAFVLFFICHLEYIPQSIFSGLYLGGSQGYPKNSQNNNSTHLVVHEMKP